MPDPQFSIPRVLAQVYAALQAVITLQNGAAGGEATAAPPGVPGGAWNGIVVRTGAKKEDKSGAESVGGEGGGPETQGAPSGGTDSVDAANDAATTSASTSPAQAESCTAPEDDEGEGGQTAMDAKGGGADDGKEDAADEQQPGESSEAAASDQDTNPPTDAADVIKSETSSYKGIIEQPSS
jgi:hypothetical protein